MYRILVYGAGAIGSAIAYLLSDKNCSGAVQDVALLGRAGHMARIRESGLDVEWTDGRKNVRFEHCFSSLEELDASAFVPDLVIICVKTKDLPAVGRDLAEGGQMNGKLRDSEFLLMMNGMGNKQAFGLDSPSVQEGTTFMGVVFAKDGHIQLRGKGATVVSPHVRPKTAEFLSDRFGRMGFEVAFPKDFHVQQWNKLIVNAVINPLTALCGCCNGMVLSATLRPIVEGIVREAVAVAITEGVDVGFERSLDTVLGVAQRTAKNNSSMLQDIRRGRKTEIDSINGYIVSLAAKRGIDVPMNRTLLSLVKMLEGGMTNSGVC
jgi:2-dehydropantoate 2-reductase